MPRQSRQSTAPAEVELLQFSPLGIEGIVRRPDGERLTFDSLSRLRIALYEGTISHADDLSFNHDMWRQIDDIPDLRAYFWAVWQRGQRGGLPRRRHTIVEAAPSMGPTDEFDDDAPTRLMSVPSQSARPRLIMPPMPAVHTLLPEQNLSSQSEQNLSRQALIEEGLPDVETLSEATQIRSPRRWWPVVAVVLSFGLMLALAATLLKMLFAA